MRQVRLKNGSEVFEPQVIMTMKLLQKIFVESRPDKMLGPVAIYELVAICKNPDHKLFGSFGERLAKLTLLRDVSINGEAKYAVQDTVRDIVLSAVDGQDMEGDFGLVNPVADGD